MFRIEEYLLKVFSVFGNSIWYIFPSFFNFSKKLGGGGGGVDAWCPWMYDCIALNYKEEHVNCITLFWIMYLYSYPHV
jgi:hypothetical protein